MTEKERIEGCIGFKKTDAVPWQIDCTTGLARLIMEDRGIAEERLFLRGRNVLTYHRLYEYLGNHLCYIRSEPVDGYAEAAPGIWRDEWGVLWDRRIDHDIGNPVNVPLEKGNLDTLQIPDPWSASRFAHFGPIIEASPGRYVVVKISRCLFERAWSLRGMENLLIDLKDNPSFVHELFETITGFGLALIDGLEAYAVDGVRFSDDWGGQLGMLMSPDTWRVFIKPYAARLYGRARERGYSVFIHSCGNVTSILDDLVEIGVNVFNPLQPETMDVETVLARYAGRLAFYGGLSIQRTLPFGSAKEVRGEVTGRLALARRYGGYLIAPAHDMPPDVPPENVQAMLEVLQAQMQ